MKENQKEEILKKLKLRMEIMEIISPDIEALGSKELLIHWIDTVFKSGFRQGAKFIIDEIDSILAIKEMED